MIKSLTNLSQNHTLYHLSRRTSCPYAFKSTLCYAEDQEGSGRVHDSRGAVEAMKLFINGNLKDSIDILFLCFPDQNSDVDTITLFFRDLIADLYLEINGELPKLPHYFEQNPRVQLGGVSFFITVHAPVYKEKHSRHSFGSDLVIGFQPYESFKRFNVKEAHQQSVRKKFARDGKPYSPSVVVDSENELEKFIKPMKLTDDPVRWWE